jgi:RNA polymerase sigma factor (sigma-70 family)
LANKDKQEMDEMNDLAKQDFNSMNEFDKVKLIKLIYSNVTRYTYSVFSKVGRPLTNTLQKDKFDGMVQEVVFGLVDILQKNKYESSKAKFSTVLATHVNNKVFKEGYLESMAKRKGILVPLTIQTDDGGEIDYLSSDENVEDSVVDYLEQQEKIKIVQDAISKLAPRDQIIINMRMQEKSLEEIGKKIGVTRERVRQILIKIFNQLEKNIDVSLIL